MKNKKNEKLVTFSFKQSDVESKALTNFHNKKMASDIKTKIDLQNQLKKITSIVGARDAIFSQAELIYEYYILSYTKNNESEQKALYEQYKHKITRGTHPLAIMFVVFCKINQKTANKRARALRYALCEETKPKELKSFILKNKGFETCSRKFSVLKGVSKYATPQEKRPSLKVKPSTQHDEFRKLITKSIKDGYITSAQLTVEIYKGKFTVTKLKTTNRQQAD